MKKVLILLSIMTMLSLSSCMGGGTPVVESEQIDSASTHTETENDTTIKISNEMDIKDLKTILNKNIEEDMIDISSFFSPDEIESIRYFDVDSQRSLNEIEETLIYPFTEFILNADKPCSNDNSKENCKDRVNDICELLAVIG